MTVKLDTNSIRYIALFERMTDAKVKDCLIEDDKIIILVRTGDMGLAIGKGGMTIKEIQRAIGKPVRVYEYSENPKEFIKNLFGPIAIKKINIVTKNTDKIANVILDTKQKGKAIGRRGENIERIKVLLQRHHGIKDVVIK